MIDMTSNKDQHELGRMASSVCLFAPPCRVCFVNNLEAERDNECTSGGKRHKSKGDEGRAEKQRESYRSGCRRKDGEKERKKRKQWNGKSGD